MFTLKGLLLCFQEEVMAVFMLKTIKLAKQDKKIKKIKKSRSTPQPS